MCKVPSDNMIRTLNAIITTLAVPFLMIFGCLTGFLVLCGAGYLVMSLLFYGFTGC